MDLDKVFAIARAFQVFAYRYITVKYCPFISAFGARIFSSISY